MPRAGPRPYECVKRAWHSDRNQPIRGTIIQEIFRVVSENHSPKTKKNKEWQDKLPAVVLRAEEIMYSKANSEAEYMDLKTLWGRANDAINMIIRRDESAETGGILLQPCIEAALTLGCIPRKASRGQRNNSPRCYLSPSTQESPNVPSGVVEIKAEENHPHLGLETQDSAIRTSVPDRRNCAIQLQNVPPPNCNQCLHMEAHPSFILCPIYPLLNKNDIQCFDFGSGTACTNLMCNTNEPSEVSSLQDLLSCHETALDDSANKKNNVENVIDSNCDLSLRLGPVLDPCMQDSRTCHQEIQTFGHCDSHEGSKCGDRLVEVDSEFLCFPRGNSSNLLESCSSRKSSRNKILDGGGLMRKRKTVYGAEDKQSFLQPKLSFNRFAGRIRNSGL